MHGKELTQALNKLAVEIAKREGKKSQVNIANIKELLKVICTMAAEESHATRDVSWTWMVLSAYTDAIETKIIHANRNKKVGFKS